MSFHGQRAMLFRVDCNPTLLSSRGGNVLKKKNHSRIPPTHMSSEEPCFYQASVYNSENYSKYVKETDLVPNLNLPSKSPFISNTFLMIRADIFFKNSVAFGVTEILSPHPFYSLQNKKSPKLAINELLNSDIWM